MVLTTPWHRRRRPPQPALGATPDVDLLTTRGPGEEDALAELFRRHGGYVYAAAAHLLEGETAAAVARDTFVRCWNDRHAWAAGAETLREQLVSHARAVAGAVRLEDPRVACEPAPDRVIDRLSSLTESQAATLALLTLGGCTFAEAATLLGRPEAQVRRQSLQALHALRP